VDNVINFETARAAETELKRRLEQLHVLLDIGRSMGSQLELRELIGVISDCLREVIHCDAFWMSLIDPESGQLRVYALDPKFNKDALAYDGKLVPLEDTLAEKAIKSLQTLLFTRADLESSPSPVVQRIAAQGIRSSCLAPLISRGRAIGVISMASLRENAFAQEDADLLTLVAGQIAIAVENALNFARARAAEEQAKRQSERLQLLLEINNAVVSNLDLKALMPAIFSSLRKMLPYDVVGLGVYDAETNQLRSYANVHIDGFIKEGEPIPLEGSIPGLVFTTGEPILLDRLDDPRFQSDWSKRFRQAGFKSGGSVPVLLHGRRLGTLGVAARSETHISEEDVELLCQVANQLAIAVENALNFERASAAEEQAKRQSERLQLLLEINNAVISNLDLRSLMETISICLAKVSHYDAVGLALYDPEINQLRAYSNPTDQAFIDEGQPIPFEGSAPGLAFTTGKPVLLDRHRGERLHSDFNSRFRKAGFKSGGAVPLIAHGRKLGTLGFATLRETTFSDDEVEMLCQVANQVAIAVENVLSFREIETLKNKLTSEKLYLEAEIRTEHNFEELIGSSPSFKRILKQVETVAPTDSAVLIRGETGTGKELLARAIHNLSARRERTLVKINCAAIPTGLLESELFGHEKGAFTGAIAQRIGRFELANKGSLFLDEVGDIPLELQPKLLRVLQEQEFERLGSTRTQKVDVRLIAATNSDLEQMVADKRYRSDLYYRLNVFPVTIPPLRERREDIPVLARFFTQKYAQRLKKRIEAISAEAMAALTGYHWPGNVRELEHFIERAVVLTQGPDLEVSISELKSVAPTAQANISTLEAAEREHIMRALEEANWVVGGTNGAGRTARNETNDTPVQNAEAGS
jgi:formate hydrogenlyase transcriptional activator